MAVSTAKIINVIEVKSEHGLSYFTLDGLKIGGFTDQGIDTDEHPAMPSITTTQKPPGGVAKNMTPKKAAIQKDKDDENLATRLLGRKDQDDDDNT